LWKAATSDFGRVEIGSQTFQTERNCFRLHPTPVPLYFVGSSLVQEADDLNRLTANRAFGNVFGAATTSPLSDGQS
jgi:hypothetical protein